MLVVEVPPGYDEERRYAARLVADFLGLNFIIESGAPGWTVFRRSRRPSDRVLRVRDVLFSTPREDWLSERALPKEPLSVWCRPERSAHANLPVIYGRPLRAGRWLQETASGGLELGVDIFGSIFFMVTRFEEHAIKDRDMHGRFPASRSLAYRERILERPLVDEYVEALADALRTLWPDIRPASSSPTFRLTHDVDRPSSVYGKSAPNMARRLIGDLVKRRSPGLAKRRLRAWLDAQRGYEPRDPTDSFPFILALYRALGVRAQFYFLAGGRDPMYDGEYNIDAPHVRRLLSLLVEDGHEIGLHQSYEAGGSPPVVANEADKLRASLSSLGVDGAQIGGRHHYLRWDARWSWSAAEDARLQHDSSVGFADHVGFRCGTGRAFQVFDLVRGEPLKLVEHPLVVMDATFEYMAIDDEEADRRTLSLAAASWRHGGGFTLLWHNDALETRRKQRRYQALVEGLISLKEELSDALPHRARRGPPAVVAH